jgi:hypothetical protein
MIILLIAYGVFLLGLAGFGGLALFHAFAYGIPGDKTKIGAFLYIVVVAAIVIASLIFIGSTDFSGSEAI